jgi:hypothetical protein
MSYTRQVILYVSENVIVARTTTSSSAAGVLAVLTGDIIKSTQLSAEQLDQTRAVILKGVLQLREKSRRTVSGAPEFFRGDAWQLLLKEPGSALRAALYIRARLSAETDVRTRISIGIGGVDVINRTRTSLSTGEAFTLSGHALDKITGYFDLTGALPDRVGPLALWFPAILHLCSGLVRPWTRRQAEIISLALLLDNPTHELIARSLNPAVAKQTVTESLAGSGWRPLLKAILAFEQTTWSAVIGRQ